MKRMLFLGLMITACASISGHEFIDHARFEGFTVEQVRDAAQSVLAQVSHGRSVIRSTDERVLTEGWIGSCGRDVACGQSAFYNIRTGGTPWTQLEVVIRELEKGKGAAVKVEIEYESDSHCPEGFIDVTCHPEELGSTGALEHRIIEGIGAQLMGDEGTAKLLPR